VTGKTRRAAAKAGTEASLSHKNTRLSPEVVVQRRLDAYNARDLEASLATYAEDARQFEFPAKVLATGHAEIRARTAARLQEPNLHAKLLKRSILGSIVVDHEEVTRTFPEGPGRIELVCIYEVREGKIQNASFVFGAKTLESSV
jgi:hypothetical protein